MGVKSLTRQKKIEWLDVRLDEIRKAKALIERFENAAACWLKALEAKKAN